jgi:glycosyltransferase involved in cell wall biosynthesis
MARRPLRIAMISDHANPLHPPADDTGGQHVHVTALSRQLAALGHQVVVYTRRDAPDVPDWVRMGHGLVVEHVPAGPPEPLPPDELAPYLGEFRDQLAERWSGGWSGRPPSVVHAHFWTAGVAAFPGARAHGIPVVQTFHALGSVRRRHRQGRVTTGTDALDDRVAREAELATAVDRIIATCRAEVSELRRMGASPARTTVVPAGVDTDQFSLSGPVARRGRRRRLLAVGRLAEREGLADLVRALADVPETELVVAGGPDAEHLDGDPAVTRLRAVADGAGVADRVRLLGRVPHADLPPLYRSADLVACTPWYEPFGSLPEVAFGVVPLEAMACGVPVVATAVGGLIDTVQDGLTGLRVPPRRPDRLAGAIRQLLADPDRRARMGATAREWARCRYCWRQVALSTELVYRELAGRHRMPAADQRAS